jgi:mannonate dehydratase
VAHGVTHVCVDPPGNPHDWSLDDLNRQREHVEKFGLSLDMVQLPLSSRPIEEAQSPHVLLGKDPERQRELDSICRLIERIGAAGIPAAKYNLNIIGIPRTANEPGRGGSRNAAFRWSDTDRSAAPTIAGTVSEDANWERIDAFLAAVVPVAEAAKVRLACHPHDPYTPPGYRGVTRVLGTVAGMQRFVTMHESRYHGLNFCQGTVAEMLDDPRREIDDVIRWFGTRGKLFNVHFRNIKGRKLDFMEAFPDEGDMDMALAAGVPGGRLSVHAHAGPRSRDRRPRSIRHRVRVLLRLYSRFTRFASGLIVRTMSRRHGRRP